MDSKTLLALAERAEAATAPDLELDFAILCEVDSRARQTGPLPGDPRYSASLDAAKTLWPGEVPHLIPSDPRMCTAMALRAWPHRSPSNG